MAINGHKKEHTNGKNGPNERQVNVDTAAAAAAKTT